MPGSGFEAIELPDGELWWAPAFLPAREADELLAVLRAEVPWEVHRIRLFGREVESPRLSCWIGDPGAAYTYSGTRFEPRPWLPSLAAVRERVVRAAGAAFNSVLANRYRDGRDSMGWHSDDEAELGPEPVIASLSLGAARRFVLGHRRRKLRRELELTHGSLLVMRGSTQRHWRHALPKTAHAVGERVNLTFRCIHAATTVRLL